MDDQTFKYYQKNAEQLAQRYNSVSGGISQFFPWLFQKGEKVLDIGSGSGRDVAALCAIGIDGQGIEPIKEFLDFANAEFPELKGRFFSGSLPDNMPDSINNKYDGIILSAVLMHIPDAQLFDSVFILRDLVKEKGKLLISVPLERDDLNTGTIRDQKNRLMIIRPEAQIRLLFERLGFKQESRWVSKDSLGRQGITWLTLIFRLYGDSGSRSADKIEEIINRDRKSTSYKLALLRSICDISLTEFKLIQWLPDNKASIPMEVVSKKWIEYFWHLFDSKVFIPQLRGEYPASKNKVSFRKSMNQLTKYYQEIGGLDQFTYDRDYKKMPQEALELLEIVENKITNAILNGPVFFSGGGNSEEKPFFPTPDKQKIVMDADLIYEMVQIGYWIRDSIILRWAELTSVFSEKCSYGAYIPSGEVITSLLIHPGLKRDVNLIKEIFATKHMLNCVWTDKDITKRFDIDHGIPFSLWRNNSLWNLFPANPKINNQKRDRLPSRNLICKRKDAIVGIWNEVYKDDRTQNRFLMDTSKFMGHDITSNWENQLFSCFQEAVETTAIRRNSERWEP